MRTAFVCIGDPFTPSMLYKENYFIRAAVENGDDVLVIASDLEWHDGRLRRLPTPQRLSRDGYSLLRLPYRSMGIRSVTEKVRILPGLEGALRDFRPEFVFYNTAQIPGITLAPALKKSQPSPRIVCDFTTTYDNSARGFLSRKVQHGWIYRSWLQKGLPWLDDIFVVARESADFVSEVYGVPAHRLELLPLPGEVIEPAVRADMRREFRLRHGLRETDLVFVHSGKMGREKETLPLMRAFSALGDEKCKLVLAGSFADDIAHEAAALIKANPRITHLGFLDGHELVEALCASDMYLQPGTVSQTAQTAICCGLPVLLASTPIYRDLFRGNGFLVESFDDVQTILENVAARPDQLAHMARTSRDVARERLDYRALYRRVAGLKGPA